jgi:hypothetical protein
MDGISSGLSSQVEQVAPIGKIYSKGKTLLSEQGQSSLAMPGNSTRENWSIGELSKIPLSAGEYWNKNRRL